jgi:hypothetical protein
MNETEIFIVSRTKEINICSESHISNTGGFSSVLNIESYKIILISYNYYDLLLLLRFSTTTTGSQKRYVIVELARVTFGTRAGNI